MKQYIDKDPYGKNSYRYSWLEKCDVCGRIIRDHSKHSSEPPDMNKKDYCNECFYKKYNI